MGRFVLPIAGGLLAALSTTASANETIAYSYDAKGRLVQVSRSGSVNGGLTTSYSHDKADNRTAKSTAGAAAQLIVVPLNGLTVIPLANPDS